ncbi:DNA repair protein RecN [Desulfonispora thiosulfatigenes DSM 11270]|uniref:DNA repair protein RecN n=1 Tax=Desulfonispora thiosulfatigenes DSM 11270 TaxID=656914 RepID=A0A1W1VNJ6_DESTI|nr:AAA family ATPase [Desulfonispora thiosulfatigenes]SMB94927.1 DNA repair protein RecN [Desulfonispora thiosulfatigenes DSM 11270]
MLLELSIRNFALIDQLDLRFDEHLNVLTGETGAGKSIIIDAVSLLLGARAQSHFIRVNQEKAMVEGSFYVPVGHPVENVLNELGHEVDEERLVILAREIHLNGKNVSRLNNRVINLTTLKKVGPELINIYGQHDFQTLSEEKMHLHLIDLLGDKSFKKDLDNLQDLYKNWQEDVKKILKLKEKINDKNQRVDFLKFQAQEIGALNLTENEDIEIENELNLLKNHEKIVSVADNSFNLLYGQNSAYDQISKAIDAVSSLKDIDQEFENILSDLKNAQISVEESARVLKGYSDNFDYDLNRKNFLEERYFEINKLKKKYGNTINEILEYLNTAKQEIDEIENSEFFIKELEDKEKNHILST